MLNSFSLLILLHILMGDTCCLISSCRIQSVSSSAFYLEMLLDVFIEGFILLVLIRLFLLYSILQFLAFLSVIVYELHSVEFISKVGHLSLLCYSLEFLLLEVPLLILLHLFVLLESEVPISNLFRFPVHDVSFRALHNLILFL